MPTAKFECSLLNRLLKPRPVRLFKDLELTQIEAKRKNFKPIDDHPQRIVVSPSGDMAYEYGMAIGRASVSPRLNRNSRYRSGSCCLPRITRTSASGLHLFGAP